MLKMKQSLVQSEYHDWGIYDYILSRRNIINTVNAADVFINQHNALVAKLRASNTFVSFPPEGMRLKKHTPAETIPTNTENTMNTNTDFYTERNAMERDLSNSYRIREKALVNSHHIYADQPKTPREAIAWLNAGYYDKLDDKDMDREYDSEYGNHPINVFSFRKTPADYKGYDKARAKLKAEFEDTTLKVKVLPPTEALTYVEKFRPTVH